MLQNVDAELFSPKGSYSKEVSKLRSAASWGPRRQLPGSSQLFIKSVMQNVDVELFSPKGSSSKDVSKFRSETSWDPRRQPPGSS